MDDSRSIMPGKEARPKKAHTMRINLYKVLELAKPKYNYGKRIGGCMEQGWGGTRGTAGGLRSPEGSI